MPSDQPSVTKKTTRTSMMPSDKPSSMPSDKPSSMPSDQPSVTKKTTRTSMMPSDKPSSIPSDKPSSMPSDQPSSTKKTTRTPTSSDQPSFKPTLMPSFKPSACVDLSMSPFPSFADLEELKDAANLWVNGSQSDVEAEYGPIEDWNVECVTDMTKLFCGLGGLSHFENNCDEFAKMQEFNADISEWNVGQLGNMNMMFREADSFNVDISKWNVAAVTNMRRVFYHNVFNINLCEWGEKAQSIENIYTFQMFDGSNCPNEDEPTATNWCFNCN